MQTASKSDWNMYGMKTCILFFSRKLPGINEYLLKNEQNLKRREKKRKKKVFVGKCGQGLCLKSKNSYPQAWSWALKENFWKKNSIWINSGLQIEKKINFSGRGNAGLVWHDKTRSVSLCVFIHKCGPVVPKEDWNSLRETILFSCQFCPPNKQRLQQLSQKRWSKSVSLWNI